MAEPIQETDEGNSSEDEINPDKVSEDENNLDKSSDDERNPDKSSEGDGNPDKSSDDENNPDKSSEGEINPDKSPKNVPGLDIMDLFTETHSKITCANCCQTFDGLVEISKHFESCTADMNDTKKESNVGHANDFPGWSDSDSDDGFPKNEADTTTTAMDPSKQAELFLKETKSMQCEFCNAFINEDAMVSHLWRHTHEPRHKSTAVALGMDSKPPQNGGVHEKKVMMCEFCNLYQLEDTMFRHLLRHTLVSRHIKPDADKNALKALKDFLNPAFHAKPVKSNDAKKSSKLDTVDTFADCIAEITEDCSEVGGVLKRLTKSGGNRKIEGTEATKDGDPKKQEKGSKADAKGAPKATLCEICGLEYKNITSHLKSHKNERDGKKKEHICKVCDKPFKNSLGLKRHNDVHIEERNFGCRPCGKFFKSRRALKKHLLGHSRTKKYFCTICSKVFSCPRNRDRHMDIHNAVRKHVCTMCNKSFTQLKSLQDHLDTHEGKIRFFCTCGRGFTHKGALLTHKYHAHGKGYKYRVRCKTCGRKFRTDEALYEHAKEPCKDKRRYFCSTCGDIFSKECAALGHQKSTNARVHVCNVCSKAYETRVCLNQHVNLKHRGKRTPVTRRPRGPKGTPGMKAKIAAIIKRGPRKKKQPVNHDGVMDVPANNDWPKSVAMNQDWMKNMAMNQDWARNVPMNHDVARNVVVPSLNHVTGMSVPVNHDWVRNLAMAPDVASNVVVESVNYANAMNMPVNHEWVKSVAMNHEGVINMSMNHHGGMKSVPMLHEGVKNMAMAHGGMKNLPMIHEGMKNMAMHPDVARNMSMHHGGMKNMYIGHEDDHDMSMDNEPDRSMEPSPEPVKPERVKKTPVKNRVVAPKNPEVDEQMRKLAMNHEGVKKAVMKSMAFNRDSAKIAAMHHGDLKSAAVVKVEEKKPSPKKKESSSAAGQKQTDDDKLDGTEKVEKVMHKCHICFKSYARKRMFDRHLLFHSGIDTKRERRKKDKELDKKLAECEDKYKYKCDLCPKAYTQQHVLETHLVTHTGIRPYSCTICQKSFFQKPHLTAHMRLHVEEKEFSCHICAGQFRHKGNLTAHLKKVHGLSQEEALKKRPKINPQNPPNIPQASSSNYEKPMMDQMPVEYGVEESGPPAKKSRRKGQPSPKKKDDKRSHDYFKLISFMNYNLMRSSTSAQPQMQHEWNY